MELEGILKNTNDYPQHTNLLVNFSNELSPRFYETFMRISLCVVSTNLSPDPFSRGLAATCPLLPVNSTLWRLPHLPRTALSSVEPSSLSMANDYAPRRKS